MRTLTLGDPTIHRSAVFNPKDIVGCRACWIGSDLALTDGATITTWTDRKNGIVLGQTPTGAGLPTYDADGVGGKPAANFSSAMLELTEANALSTALNGHVFLVMRFNGFTGSATPVWSSQNTQFSNGAWKVQGRVNTGGLLMEQDNGFSGADTLQATTLVPSFNTDYLVEWESTGTAYNIRLNGTALPLSVLAGANTGDWFGDTTNRGNFVLAGSRTSSSQSSGTAMRVAELIVVDGAVSAGDRAQYNAYVTSQYGITVA